jgi:four helix bundle protein
MENDRQRFKREFKNKIYKWVLQLLKFIDDLPKDSVSRILGNQLVRSGTSILSNYVEAHSSSSKKDFAFYFRIALRSANESKVWLALLRDTKRGKTRVIDDLLEELQEIAAILASSIITIKKQK